MILGIIIGIIVGAFGGFCIMAEEEEKKNKRYSKMSWALCLIFMSSLCGAFGAALGHKYDYEKENDFVVILNNGMEFHMDKEPTYSGDEMRLSVSKEKVKEVLTIKQNN